MLSGLWLTPLLALLSLGHERAEDGSALDVYVVITAGFWIGHRLSSSLLAWGTAAYRPVLRTQRTRLVWIPVAIVAVVFSIVMPDDDHLPWTRAERTLALASVDATLIIWHFAAQHFGVLSLYRLRAHRVGPSLRRADRVMALGVGGVVVLLAELLAGTTFLQQHGLLDHMETTIMAWGPVLRWAGAGTVVVVTVVVVVIDLRHGWSWPRCLALLNVAVMALVALAAQPFVFLVVWTAQHWLAAVGLSTMVAVDVNHEQRPCFVIRRPWRLPLLVTLSVLLFPVMEIEAVGEAERLSALLPGVTALMGSLVATLSSSSLAPLLVALGFASAFVHYHLDRAVFRLSDPAVRRAVGITPP